MPSCCPTLVCTRCDSAGGGNECRALPSPGRSRSRRGEAPSSKSFGLSVTPSTCSMAHTRPRTGRCAPSSAAARVTLRVDMYDGPARPGPVETFGMRVGRMIRRSCLVFPADPRLMRRYRSASGSIRSLQATATRVAVLVGDRGGVRFGVRGGAGRVLAVLVG